MLVQVIVEHEKFASDPVILIHVALHVAGSLTGLFTCISWGISGMNSQCYLNLWNQRLLYSMEAVSSIKTAASMKGEIEMVCLSRIIAELCARRRPARAEHHIY